LINQIMCGIGLKFFKCKVWSNIYKRLDTYLSYPNRSINMDALQ
jgi:hypothetical protein